jgi:hypothetical protein
MLPMVGVLGMMGKQSGNTGEALRLRGREVHKAFVYPRTETGQSSGLNGGEKPPVFLQIIS